MKLKDYVEHLTQILETNPDAMNYTVIYASDDEGNTFDHVHYPPCLGNFDGEHFNSVSSENNSICIN
jgi:hypothetical protein